MRRAEALTQCLTGLIMTCPSLDDGVGVLFQGGTFFYCNEDGEATEPCTSLPTDETGWEEFEIAVDDDQLAVHINNTSGNAFISRVGSEKFQTRQANTALTFVGYVVPSVEEAA